MTNNQTHRITAAAIFNGLLASGHFIKPSTEGFLRMRPTNDLPKAFSECLDIFDAEMLARDINVDEYSSAESILGQLEELIRDHDDDLTKTARRLFPLTRYVSPE